MAGIRSATYLYDANGTKLKSVQTADGVTTTREYISGIQYTNGAIDFIQADEGMAVRNAGNGTYKYQYNLKDHLGNTRVSIDDNGSGTAEVTQEDEYYAFGLDVPKFRLTTENKYLYNGKEKQDVLTDELDYGARFYDPVIGRWTSVDPLAEKSRRFSPYVYGDDNSIRNIDPDGMETQGCCDVFKAIKDWANTPLTPSQQFRSKALSVNNNVVSKTKGEAFLQALNTGFSEAAAGNAGFAGPVRNSGSSYKQIRGQMSEPSEPFVNNAVPKTVSRVVPNIDGIKDLAINSERAFVTAPGDIKGMNAQQIQTRLGIDASPTGYQVFTFPTPEGIATPLIHEDTRFVGKGLTSGGAREFTVPNQPIPKNAKKTIVE